LNGLGDTNITLDAFDQITVGVDASVDLKLSDLSSGQTLTFRAGHATDDETGSGSVLFHNGSSIETGGGNVVIDAGAGFAGAAATKGQASLGSITTHGGDITVAAGGSIKLPQATALDSA